MLAQGVGWKEVCKVESLSNACVDPGGEKLKCFASVGNQRNSCRAIARWAAIPSIHFDSTLYCNAIAIAVLQSSAIRASLHSCLIGLWHSVGGKKLGWQSLDAIDH